MKNKVVWITGASSGIGAACAIECSKQGAKVVLSARREEKLKEVKKQLSGPSEILTLDVTDTDGMVDKAEACAKYFGPVDILINNAGISQRGLVEETDMAVDRRLFEVNYFGNIAITKAVLPSMLERKTGSLVIISSVAGKLSTPGRSSYAATKHALQGFYDALRAEVQDRGVHVNVICPGYIRTDISINALNSKGEKHGVMDPNQDKGMSPEECASKIIKAINNNTYEALIGGKEVRNVMIRKFLPKVYYNVIAKMAREKRY